jgi:O-antigen/teichoic acid export membrane protein|tara:strand:- start:801 stop:1943 length:1143 start_codon:yes stop_codon:yes gene_type:complete
MNQLKSLTKIGIADIIGTGISAGFWIFLASLISPETYGELHYFLSIAAVVSYLTLIGSQNTITVYVAKKIQIQSTFNFLSLISAIVGFLILFLIFERVDIGLLVIGYTVNNLVIGELFGKKEYKSYFKYILIQKITTPIFGISFFLGFGIEGVIYGLALTYTAFYFRIIKVFKEVKIDFLLLRKRKGFIVNNYFIALTGTLHGQIDKLIVMPILGSAILGNYSLSLQIINILMIVTSILFKYMVPEEASGKNIKQIRKILIINSMGLTLIGLFVVPEILPIVFPEYSESIDAIKIMSLGIIPMSVVQIYTSKFLALEKSKFIMISIVVFLTALTPSMIIFGDWYGVSGIAMAFVISTIIQAIFFYIVNRKWNKKQDKIRN